MPSSFLLSTIPSAAFIIASILCKASKQSILAIIYTLAHLGPKASLTAWISLGFKIKGTTTKSKSKVGDHKSLLNFYLLFYST